MFTEKLIEDYIAEASLDFNTELRKINDWRMTGRRNVSAMSNEKLKFDYDICIGRNFNYEASILKAEARSRGLAWGTDERIDRLNLTENDFHLADASFIKEHSTNTTAIVNNFTKSYTPLKDTIIAIVFALVLHLPKVATALKKALMQDFTLSEQSIKDATQQVVKAPEIVKRLTEIINELNTKTESLKEDVEKHDILNPKLWNEDNTLKPEVEEKINAIVADFLKALEDDEIKINVKDIKLVGSNCSYNYNDKSDLDVHIEADTDSLGCPDNLYPLLYSAYRSIWNKNHDVEFYGIPVEIFVETSDTEQQSEPTEVELHEAILTLDHAVKDSLYNLYSKGYEEITPEDVAEDIAYHYDGYEDWVDEIETPEKTEKYKNILASIMTCFNKYYDEYFGESLKEARQQTALKSNGIYSVMNHKWIKEPVAEDIPEVDQEAFNMLLAEWQDKARDAKESSNPDTITKFIEDIYDLRKTSIADEGEYGLGNLVFKELRNDGTLDELRDLKNQTIDKELSLESLTEGCWGMPYKLSSAKALKKMFEKPIIANTVGDTRDSDPKHIPLGDNDSSIGDDELFDRLSNYRKMYGDRSDVRSVIANFIAEDVLPNFDNYSYASKEGDYQGNHWEDGVKEIFKEIATMDLKESILTEDLVFDYTKEDVEKMFKLVQEETDKDKAKYLRDILNKGLFELYMGGKGDGLDDWRKGRHKEITSWLKANPLQESLQEAKEEKTISKEDIRKIVEDATTKLSKITMFEVDGFPFELNIVDQEEKDYGGNDYYTFWITGGLNGSGSWKDYLKDLTELFKTLEEKTGLEPYIIKEDTDCADDVFNVQVGLTKRDENIKLTENLTKKLLTEENEFGKYKSQFIKQINSINPSLLTRGKETRQIYNKNTHQMDEIALWDSQLHYIDGNYENNPADGSNWALIQCEDGQSAANKVHKLLHLYPFAEDGKLAQDLLTKINSYKPIFIRLIDGELVINKTVEDYWQSGGNALSAQALQKLSTKKIPEALKESQAQEIGSLYQKLSKLYHVNLEELVYGKDGFMKSCYPNGFPNFAGDVIYSPKYWDELEKWALEAKGIDLAQYDGDPENPTVLEDLNTSEIDDNKIFDIYDDDDWEIIENYLIDDIPEELHYEDMTVCVGYIPATYWDPGEAIEGEADWDYYYEYDPDDLWNYIKQTYRDGFTGKDLKEFNMEDFEAFLLNKYEDLAAKNAWEKYEPEDYEPDYEPDYFDSF